MTLLLAGCTAPSPPEAPLISAPSLDRKPSIGRILQAEQALPQLAASLARSQPETLDLSPLPGLHTELRPLGPWPKGAVLEGHRLRWPGPGLLRLEVTAHHPTADVRRFEALLFRADPSASGFLPLLPELRQPLKSYRPGWELPPDRPSLRWFASDAAFEAWLTEEGVLQRRPQVRPGPGAILVLRFSVSLSNLGPEDYTLWANQEGHVQVVAPYLIPRPGIMTTHVEERVLCFRAPAGFRQVRSLTWNPLWAERSYAFPPEEGLMPSPEAPASAASPA